MTTKSLDPKTAHAMRERIAFLKDLVDRFGPEVYEVAEQRNRQNIVPAWKALGEQMPAADIENFVNLLWNRMGSEDGFEFTVQTDGEKTQIHCTYCPWVAVAQAAGSTEAGYHVLCLADPLMIEGFNQAAGPGERKIKFTRSKTLMQGDDCCDHCYEYE